MQNTFLLLVLGLFITETVEAQIPVSPDKEFWKKRVVRRIDLREKINRPLVYHESDYYDESRFSEKDGIVTAIFNGLRDRQYRAYNPEDWKETWDYPQLIKRMMEFDQSTEPQQPSIEGFYDVDREIARLQREFSWLVEDESFTPNAAEWGGFQYLENLAPFEAQIDTQEEETGPYPAQINDYKIDYGQYEESMHIVEDWIFNSERSSMQQNIRYFEIIWTDPSGQLPEKVLARFRWEDIDDVLAKTQWKNRFNDAEVRSIKEVIELRIFHGYAINVGGEPIRSLSEAALREQQMVEFEHYLWSY
ncbi:MAG: hypothetical protein R3B47_15945 [Bacteroidia bacterium]